MGLCQQEERAAGRPYPRTCPTCKLGPCSRKLTGSLLEDAAQHALRRPMTITPDEAEAMVALIGWLRNPWINAAPENERGPLPEWVYALMHEAADSIAALSRLREADRAEIERLRGLVSSSEKERYQKCSLLLIRAEAAEARVTALEADRVKVAETALRMAGEKGADEALRALPKVLE